MIGGLFPPALRFSQPIGRTVNASTAAVQHMGVNHGGADIAMAEQFLNRTDVIPIFEQMSCKRMPERVRSGWLCYPGLTHGLFHGLLQDRFVQVMPAFLSCCFVYVMSSCRKNPLPSPLFPRIGVFALEGVGQNDSAQAAIKVAPVCFLLVRGA